MTQNHPDADEKAIKRRLETLSAQLSAKRSGDAEEAARAASQNSSMGDAGRAMSLGFRAVTELLVGLGMGVGIGWLLDGWLGTKPFLMLIFLFLGMAAGVWNVIRIARQPVKTRM